MNFSRSKYAVVIAVGVVVAACGVPAATRGPATLVPFPGTPTACAQVEILPTIEEIRPAKIVPGTEVTVIASGGYLQDNCGGFIEGSRIYKIYFDNEPVADLSCYVNHCEGKFTLPAGVAAGLHCMGVQKGSCQTEVDVAEQ